MSLVVFFLRIFRYHFNPLLTDPLTCVNSILCSARKHPLSLDHVYIHLYPGCSPEVTMSYFAARSAETTLPCPHCQKKLLIARTCHKVFMRCPACEKEYPLEKFIAKADPAMEHFLENVYCDRI